MWIALGTIGSSSGEKDAASRLSAESNQTNLDAQRDYLRLLGRTEHWSIQARRRLACFETRDGKEVVIKTDDRGRTIDVHALRHTFGTHLSKAGIPLRTAQAACAIATRA